ncbi:MAG: dihydrolipoyl dehydrogenase, partial [Spirochaetales bacterium]
VGLSETDAKKEGREIEVARFPWQASGRALTMGRSHGLTKLVVEKGTERVIGVGIAGAHAGELIPEGVLALEMAATVRDIELTIHPHPTLSETIRGAAERFFGAATDV